MRRLDDLGGEITRAVALELAADHRDVFVGIGEHRRRRVQRDRPVAALDEIDERLLLLGRDLGVVAVNHQRVVVRSLAGTSASAGRGDVGELNATARHRGGEQREHLHRIVRPLFLLAEEQDANGAPGLGAGRAGAALRPCGAGAIAG